MVNYKMDYETIKKLSKHMVVLVDTREKVNNHILQYFDKNHIAYESQALDYGDYTFLLPKSAGLNQDIYFHHDIVIERKNSLEELSGNLGKERDRFEKELLKAKGTGAKVYLLVEDPEGYNAIMKHKYDTQYNPAAYIASLKSFEHRFGLNIQFVDKQYSGYLIYSTFYYYMREYLH